MNVKVMILTVSLAVGSVGQAEIFFDGSPETGPPPSQLGLYYAQGFEEDPRPLYEDVFEVPSGCGGEVLFDLPMSHRRIGEGWATWSHGYTGDVYFTNGLPAVALTMPADTDAFYFYAEPASFSPFYFEAIANDGTSSGLIEVEGAAGAKYFGFYATGCSTIAYITVATDPAAGGFAVGEFGVAGAKCRPLVEPGWAARPSAAPGGGGGDEGPGAVVHRFSGELNPTAVDLRVPGRQLDFVWQRSFRSRVGGETSGGHGWSASYDLRLAQDDADLLLGDGTGRLDRYVPQGGDSYTCLQFFRELREEVDGTYTVEFEDTGTWTFNELDGSPSEGRVASITHRAGETLTFDYDVDGRLATVTDTLGRPIDLAYHAGGLLKSVTDWGGRETKYEYYLEGEAGGSPGDLKSVTTPAVTGTPTGNDFPDGKTTTYTYTKGFGDERLNHDLLTTTDPRGQTYEQNVYAHTVDPGDPRYTLDEDDVHFDRLVRRILGDAGDVIDYYYTKITPDEETRCAVLKVIENDRVGNVREYFYDRHNREVLRREYTGRADADTMTTEVDNRPTGKLRPDDPDYFETQWEYNDDGLVTRILHPNGNEEQFTYDETNPDPRMRSNLLEHCRLPGPLGGDQTQVCESFEYEPGFGGCGVCSAGEMVELRSEDECPACARQHAAGGDEADLGSTSEPVEGAACLGCCCCGGGGGGGCGSFVTRHVDGRGNETLHEYDAHGNRTHTQHRIPSIVEDWEYNTSGQVTAHTLPDNGSGHRRRDEYTYYTTGPQKGYLHQEIVDAGGFALTTTHEYDAYGNVIKKIDPRGHDTQFIVNQLDQVVREISREVTAGEGVRYQRDTYYDANDNVVRVDVQNIDDQGILQPNTHYTTVYEFETLNRVIRQCAECGEHTGSIPGPPEEPTCEGLPEEDFATTEYEYDANRNRTLVRYGEAVNGNDPDNVVQTRYDERDLVFREIRAPGSSMQSSSQYDYDGNENRLKTSRGLEDVPRVTSETYDGYDRLVSSTDPMGNVTSYHYDANGNQTEKRVDGELVDAAGGSGNVRLLANTYVYDEMDRLIDLEEAFFDTETQAPIGDGLAVTVTEYNDNSQVVRVVNDNGHEVAMTYDTANRELAVTDAPGNSRQYTYDANSNLVTLTETEKPDLGGPDEIYYTNYTYDGLDRRIRTENNIGSTTEFGYDSRNNLTLTVDAEAQESRYSYDGLDRRIEVVYDLDGDGADGDDPDVVIALSWDDSSRLTARTDDNTNTTGYEYDSLNRLTARQYADGTARTYTYDVHGNQVTVTDGNGSVAAVQYDLNNRPVRRDITPGPGVSGDITFEDLGYDGMSRLVAAADDDSAWTAAYDSRAKTIRETLNGRLTVSQFDGVGNELETLQPGGRLITRTFDDLERVKTVSDGGGLIATYDYVGPTRVARRDNGNGTRTEYTYDGLPPNPPDDYGVRMIVGTTHSVISGGQIIDQRSYTWDRLSNKTQRRDLRAGGPQWTHDYAYDALSRLVQSAITDGGGTMLRTADYDFDGVGNRIAVEGGPDAGFYFMDPTLPEPGDRQMNQYTLIPAGRRTYDANGNLIGMAAPGDCDGDGHVDLDDFGGEDGFHECLAGPDVAVEPQCACYDLDGSGSVDLGDFALFQRFFTGPGLMTGFVMTYDYRNQMVEYEDLAAGRHHTYSYDPLGRRIGRTLDAYGLPEVTQYCYDQWQVVEELDEFGLTQASYVYGSYIDEVLTMRRGGEDHYYHADDLHNVMALTDAAGGVVERYEYEDYGRPTLPTAFEDFADSPIDWSFLGEAYHEAVDQVARLMISGKKGKAGAVFFSATGYEVGGFEVEFDFLVTDPAGSFLDESGLADPDGLTFVVAGTLPTEPGGFGLDLGYGGFSADSFAVEFDAFHNDFDPDSNHVGIDVAGSVVSIATAPVSTDFEETGIWHALIRFEGGVLGVVLTPPDGEATTVLSAVVPPENVPAVKYFGFTSGTGANSADTDVDSVHLRLLESQAGNPYMFTGRRYDPETGLYYFRTRYLDPVAGRYTTRDTIGIWGDWLNLGNGYTYAGNNPWSRLDPSGHWSWTCVWWVGICAASILAASGVILAAIAACAGTVGLACIAAALGIPLAVLGAIGACVTMVSKCKSGLEHLPYVVPVMVTFLVVAWRRRKRR